MTAPSNTSGSFSVRKIQQPDGSFTATYSNQNAHESYNGEFGPRGGKRNYAARRIAEILS